MIWWLVQVVCIGANCYDLKYRMPDQKACMVRLFEAVRDLEKPPPGGRITGIYCRLERIA